MSILTAIGVVGILTAFAVYLMIGMAWQEFQRARSVREGSEQARSVPAMLVTAIRGRCPHCGRGKISVSLWRMNLSCAVCGISFVQGEGEWIGPVVINYSAALGAALVSWAVLVLCNASAAQQIVIAALIAIVVGLAIAPLSRSFWTLFLYLNQGVQ